jgi:hypothetical protein
MDYEAIAAKYGAQASAPVDLEAMAAKYGAKPPRQPNQAAMNPEVNTPFGTIQWEADNGFNIGAYIIKAGHALDRLNKGILQAKDAPGNMLRQAMGMQPTPLSGLMAQEQEEVKQPMKDLQEVHPGSTLLGDVTVAAPMPWRMLPAIAAAEYGTPTERAVRGGAALAGNALAAGGAKLAQRGVERSTAKAAANAEANKANAPFRDAGFVMPPSQTNPTLTNRIIEGFSGGTKTEQATAVKNQPIVDRLINEDLGIQGNASVKALQAIRKNEGKAYAEVAKHTYRADDAFLREIQSLRPSIADEIPEMANPAIDNLIKALSKEELTGRTAVDLSKRLRFQSTKNFQNRADPEKLELATAQRDAAEALEALITRNLAAAGQVEKAAKWEAARIKIAKTYTAEAALNDATGHYAAKELTKSKKPLDGNFKLVRDFADAYPKSVQTIDSATKANPFSVLDTFVSGIGAASAGNPALMAGVLARPAVRAAITSQPYQRFMTRPSEARGGLLGARALDNEMAPWIAGLLGYEAANR